MQPQARSTRRARRRIRRHYGCVFLLGMITVGLGFVSGLGIAAAATVAVTLLASITLLPALLGVFHSKVEVTRWRGLIAAGGVSLALLGVGLSLSALSAIGAVFAVLTVLGSIAIRPLRNEVPPRRERPLRETASYRWSRQIQRRPWLYASLGGGLLIMLALPVLSLRLGFSDEGNLSGETRRRAYDMIAEGFGPGFNGPLLVALKTSDPGDVAHVQGLTASLEADVGIDRCAAVPEQYDESVTQRHGSFGSSQRLPHKTKRRRQPLTVCEMRFCRRHCQVRQLLRGPALQPQTSISPRIWPAASSSSLGGARRVVLAADDGLPVGAGAVEGGVDNVLSIASACGWRWPSSNGVGCRRYSEGASTD